MVCENYLEIIIFAVSRADRKGEENQPLWVGKGKRFSWGVALLPEGKSRWGLCLAQLCAK